MSKKTIEQLRPSQAYAMMFGNNPARVVEILNRAGNESIKQQWLIDPISFTKADELLFATEKDLPEIKKYTRGLSGVGGITFAMTIWEQLNKPTE